MWRNSDDGLSSRTSYRSSIFYHKCLGPGMVFFISEFSYFCNICTDFVSLNIPKSEHQKSRMLPTQKLCITDFWFSDSDVQLYCITILGTPPTMWGIIIKCLTKDLARESHLEMVQHLGQEGQEQERETMLGKRCLMSQKELARDVKYGSGLLSQHMHVPCKETHFFFPKWNKPEIVSYLWANSYYILALGKSQKIRPQA